MLTAADLMTEPVCTIASSDTVAKAIDLLQQRQLRSLIVERRSAEMPYGIITERDIVYKVIARGHDPARVFVQDVMRQPCIAIEPDLTLEEVAQLFADTGIQRAPVMRDGQLLGVISVSDILHKGVSSHRLAKTNTALPLRK